MPPIDYNHLIAMLPHRGPMSLIDSVDRLAERSVETSTLINEKRTRLFGQGLMVHSYLGIELVAQSGALPLIFHAEKGRQHTGFIIQVKSFSSFTDKIEGNIRLTTTCVVERLLDGKLASVKGRVFHGKNPVCEADITLSLQNL